MRKSTSVYQFIFADIIDASLALLLYLIVFAPLVLISKWLLSIHPLFALIVLLVSSRVLAFFLILGGGLLRLVVFPNLAVGRYNLKGKSAVRWILADRVVKTIRSSIFYSIIIRSTVLRYLYFKLLGSKVAASCLVGFGADFPDPWALQIGKNVIIGDFAVLSGHLVQGDFVALGEIHIGDNALIGARSVIFPDVKIGEGAIIGAGSIVVRGTVVGPGETWSGNPAVKQSLGRLS